MLAGSRHEHLYDFSPTTRSDWPAALDILFASFYVLVFVSHGYIAGIFKTVEADLLSLYRIWKDKYGGPKKVEPPKPKV